MLPLATIRRSLAAHAPSLITIEGSQRAAVAVVLQGREDDVEVLLIERAQCDGDPWSGHMAFPGGRVDPDDCDSRAAAERETREETGVDLSTAEPLGRLDDLEGRGGRPGLVVSAFVYHAPAPGPLAPNYEVREALWVPLRRLVDPQAQITHPYPRGGTSHFPAILVGNERQVVWGLTYRFIEILFGALGVPPPRPA
jgi:8-oxo-dGTP pyrophosphatase MutT (NUDIX family)